MNADLLQQLPEPLRAEVERLLSRNALLERHNALLNERIRLMLVEKYGPSAERLSDAQLSLLELEPAVSSAEIQIEAALPDADKALEAQLQPEDAPAAKRRAPVRSALPAHLPRMERVIACAEADCTCAQCGGTKKLIGYETAERLSAKPVEFFVEVTKREKRACPACEEMGVSTAPVPPAIVEKGLLSDTLVIEVLLKKYQEHNPIYRQAQRIERDTGVQVSQSTLSASVLAAGSLLGALMAPMREELLCAGYVQGDETTVPVQSRSTKGRDHQAYLWEYSRPGGPVLYDFRMSREREGPKRFLAEYTGRLQTDGYAAYDKVGGEGLVHFACWAHARRKFFEASKVDPQDRRSVAVVAKIDELYAIERQAREAGLAPEQREAVRLEKSAPLLAAIRSMIVEVRAAVLPKSALGKACTYALSLWEKLERYAQPGHGIVEIDNNWCENAMRGVALGRKNWLHIGSEAAGPKVAAILSVLETCRRLQISAREYLEDVLPKLGGWSMSRIAELTPMAWKRDREQAAK